MHTKPIKKLTLYWGSPPKGKYIELVVILQANVFFSFLPTFFFLVKKKVWWRWWECLAHSRLTAIPSCASRLCLSQNSPASARSRSNQKTKHKLCWGSTPIYQIINNFKNWCSESRAE